MKAYKSRMADIMYDSKQNRVVFMIKNDHVICDAIGRSLHKSVKPKWYRYGKSNRLFTSGESDVGVLVEDAASACAISPVATGIALLGTNLRDVNIQQLKNLNTFTSALTLTQQENLYGCKVICLITFLVI